MKYKKRKTNNGVIYECVCGFCTRSFYEIMQHLKQHKKNQLPLFQNNTFLY